MAGLSAKSPVVLADATSGIATSVSLVTGAQAVRTVHVNDDVAEPVPPASAAVTVTVEAPTVLGCRRSGRSRS